MMKINKKGYCLFLFMPIILPNVEVSIINKKYNNLFSVILKESVIIPSM